MRRKGTNGAGTKGPRTVFLGQIPRAPSATSAMAFADQAGQPDFAQEFPGNNKKTKPIMNMCLVADRNPGLSSSKVPRGLGKEWRSSRDGVTGCGHLMSPEQETASSPGTHPALSSNLFAHRLCWKIACRRPVNKNHPPRAHRQRLLNEGWMLNYSLCAIGAARGRKISCCAVNCGALHSQGSEAAICY